MNERLERLDAWLWENCNEYLGDGKCELSCGRETGPRYFICCFMGCERAAQCREAGAICAIDLPKEFREEESV